MLLQQLMLLNATIVAGCRCSGLFFSCYSFIKVSQVLLSPVVTSCNNTILSLSFSVFCT